MSAPTSPSAARTPLLRNPANVAFVAAALIALFGGWQIARARDLAIAGAYHDVQNLNRSLAQHMERSIEAVDLVLAGIKRQVERGALDDPAQFRAYLVGHSKAVIQARNVLVLDAEGTLIAASATESAEAMSLDDRTYFLRHRDVDDGKLHIDGLIVGRIIGKPVVPMSRRWNKPDGSFGGVILAGLNPDYFQTFYARLDVGRQGVVAMVSDERRFLFRHPHDPGLAGRDLSQSPIFLEGLARAPEGRLRYRAMVDGVERIAAYEHLDGYPATVMTARSVDEALGPWRGEALLQGSALALSSLALVALGVGLGRRERRASAAETAIRSSAAKQREILNTVNDAFVSVDSNGAIAGFNRAAERMFGWAAAEVIGRPVAETITPERVRADYGRRVAAYLAAGDATATGNRVEMAGMRRDGAEFPMEVSATAAGPERAFHAFIQDISERKAREKDLADSEARFRLLAENASEMIILGHEDGRRSYVSPASERLVGYAPDEFAGLLLRDHIHPDDLLALLAGAAGLGRGEPQVTVAFRGRHKTDGWIWIEGSFRRIPQAASGEPTVVATFRDIRERVRQQAEIEAAKIAAERASLAKTEFLASMSHEIRTPLNGIIGFTGLILERGGLAPDLGRQVDLIRSSGAALLTIVNDILDFSKIEAGEIELSPLPFSPTALIAHAVAIVQGQADSNGTTIAIELDPGLPPALLGDADRLRQILLNLLNNAVKFTRRGEVRVAVGALPGGEGLRVAVSDTGVGIPADKLGRLFQRFAQVDGTVQREFGGTGLGLAISKRLVELMGGEIGVESEEGKGATFWFTAPMPRLDDLPQPRRDAAEAQSGPRGRILIVDDIALNIEIARAVLESVGHRVDEVVDGADAIAAAQANAYDLVLMDVQMPVIDGIEATRRIRAMPAPIRDTPILAMTANVLPEQVAAIRAAGMDGHVGKPFKRAELLGAVAAAMRAAPPSRAGRAPETDPELEAEPAIDREAFDALGAMFAPGLIDTLLVRLRSQIAGGSLFYPSAAAEQPALASEAHALVSSAGLLGFSRLSLLCARVETTALSGEDTSLLRLATAEACAEALRFIDERQAATAA